MTTTDTTKPDFVGFARQVAGHLGYKLVPQEDDRGSRAEIRIKDGCSIILWNRERDSPLRLCTSWQHLHRVVLHQTYIPAAHVFLSVVVSASERPLC